MPDDIEQPPRGYNTEDVQAVDEEPAVEPKPRRKRFSRWKLALTALVLLPVVAFALWTWWSLEWVYSEGERFGWVQKLSKKGWLCKTWEGELAISNIPGSMPELFRFSVRDDSVAAEINKAAGKRVALHYEEHKGVPTSCFAETDYFVTGVRILE